MSGGSRSGVDLYWLPLGARGHFLRIGGRLFEAVAARLEHREARDIYHSVLEVRVPEGRFVIEMGPVADSNGVGRGVVAEGSVGVRWAGRLRILRLEVRCWRGGVTAYNYAVESPRRLTDGETPARRILDLVPYVPTPVWGRDDLRAGEMWCCNSITSWLLAASGLPVDWIEPPAGGRAPGWQAGSVAAHRGGPSSALPKPLPARATTIAYLQELFDWTVAILSLEHVPDRVARRRACPRVTASPKMYPSRTREAPKSRHRRQH